MSAEGGIDKTMNNWTDIGTMDLRTAFPRFLNIICILAWSEKQGSNGADTSATKIRLVLIIHETNVRFHSFCDAEDKFRLLVRVWNNSDIDQLMKGLALKKIIDRFDSGF